MLFRSANATGQTQFRQDDEQFRAAIAYSSSSSPSFVLITVIDGNTGSRTTGCVPAWALIGAIREEKGLAGDQAGRRAIEAEALSHEDHIFTFRNPKAITFFNFENPKYKQACDIIRLGEPAFMDDRSGQIRMGQP